MRTQLLSFGRQFIGKTDHDTLHNYSNTVANMIVSVSDIIRNEDRIYFLKKLLRKILFTGEISRSPMFLFMKVPFSWKMRMLTTKSYCMKLYYFPEQLFTPMIKAYCAKCSKRLETGLHTYIFNDGI